MIHKLTTPQVLRAGGAVHEISAAGRRFPVGVARHPRARRYVLRVTADGVLRLTVPRGASLAGGLRFVERQGPWIEREWRRLESRNAAWDSGTAIWYRGDKAVLAVGDGLIALADHRIPMT